MSVRVYSGQTWDPSDDGTRQRNGCVCIASGNRNGWSLGFIASTVWLAKGVHCSVCLCIARVRKCFVLYVLLIFSDKKSPVLSGAGLFGC